MSSRRIHPDTGTSGRGGQPRQNDGWRSAAAGFQLVESDSDATQDNLEASSFVVESDDDQSTGAEVVDFSGTGAPGGVAENFDSATIDRLFDMSSMAANGEKDKGVGLDDSSSGDGSEVEFARKMPTYGTYGQGNDPSGLGVRRADPELDRKVTKLVQALKQYKEKVSEMKQRMRALVVEKNSLKEACEKLEEEKQEMELKAERDIRMLQYKSLGANKAGIGGNDAETQRKREEARRQMLQGDGADDDLHHFGVNESTNVGVLAYNYIRLKRWALRNFSPLDSDLRRIEARFGSSVASFFYFFRWMILNYFLMAIICLVYLVRHILNLVAFAALTDLEKESKFNSASEPVRYYDWGDRHWTQFSLILPKFLMISSFNPGDSGTQYVAGVEAADLDIARTMYYANGTIAQPTLYDPNMEFGERLDYVSMILVCNAVLLISTSLKWISEDKKAKAFELLDGSEDQYKFSKICLNMWDHSLTKKKEVEDLKYANMELINVTLHEVETLKRTASRTLKQRSILLLRRLVSNLLYISFQVGSAWLILYMTAESSRLELELTKYISEKAVALLPVASLITGSVVPITVSLINVIIPYVIQALTKFERWESAGFQLKLELTKLFVAKNLNVLIQIFSFIQLIDPFLLRETDQYETLRQNTQKTFTTAGKLYQSTNGNTVNNGYNIPNGVNECRSDYYGAGIFQLAFFDFVISKSAAVIVPNLLLLISKLIKIPLEKAEFEVARSMVNLLFFQQLCFMSFPFCPFGTILIAMMSYISFKVEKYRLESFMQKPKTPWSAKDAAAFFIKFFFITYAISLGISLFILTSTSFPKACPLAESVTSTSFSGDPLSNYMGPPRTAQQLLDGVEADVSGTLEEYLFWEEFFFFNTTGGNVNATVVPDPIQQLRQATSYSSIAVRNSTLMHCTLSCGPFVYNKSIYQPIDQLLLKHLSITYELAANSTAFVWALCSVLFLLNLFKRNKLSAMQHVHVQKEVVLRNMISSLESKLKNMKKRMDKLKQS